MSKVIPSDALLYKIHKKINERKKVSLITACLVAAFITISIMINSLSKNQN